MPESNDNSINPALYAQFLNFKPRKSDLRRISILEAAIEALSEVGVEKTTLEEVGRRASMTKAHVAYYFKNREELVEATIRLAVTHAQTYTVKRVQENPKGQSLVAAIAQGTLDWFAKNPKHRAILLLLYYYASFEPKYRQLHDEIRRLGAERLDAIVQKEFPKLPKPARWAFVKEVQSLLTGHLLEFATTTHDESTAKLEKKVMQDLHARLAAIAP